MSDARAYDDLGELYDIWCSEVVEDVEFYRNIASALAAEQDRSELRIVELGAGSGRITLELAADSHEMIGVDLSASQLSRLEQNARERGLQDRVQVIRADMRTIDQHVALGSADLVLIPFRGLLHCTQERDQVFAAVKQILRPGGGFAFDVFHSSPEDSAAVNGRWIHRSNVRTHSGKWRFDERATYYPSSVDRDPFEQKLEVEVRCRWSPTKRMIRRPDPNLLPDPIAGAQERTALLKLTTVPAQSWLESLEQAGFKIDAAYGWFDARPLSSTDTDSIWVARN